MFGAILHGFMLALGLILPLGVQNVFVFNQGALHARFRRAIPAILTASLCDTLLISLAILGVSVVVFEYEWVRILLFSLGIGFLVYMGVVTWKNRAHAAEHKQDAARSLTAKKQVTFALSVSLLNPHAVLDTVGVIGTSSLTYAGPVKAAFAVTCIGVSWLWFLGLGLAGRAAGRLDSSGRFLSGIHAVSAVIMWGTAIYLAYSLLRIWLV
ncbi:LysE/ArgO family amino acid transporter [Paenibacillus filicis]|uniref:LysE/ArgO family amino acid transporter n=1 Tax=Paenibacillus filicis TaxID=669464 RepID=A0ABU9DV89_9BACL